MNILEAVNDDADRESRVDAVRGIAVQRSDQIMKSERVDLELRMCELLGHHYVEVERYVSHLALRRDCRMTREL